MTENAFRLGILALDGCVLSSLSGPSDALRVAQILANIRSPLDPPKFETTVFSAHNAKRVTTSSGLDVGNLTPLNKVPKLDLLLVPGIDHKSPQNIMDPRRRLDVEIELLRKMHLSGTRIAATCTGTFLLAMTGLLDGHRATTSWWLASSFRQKFPAVQLEEQQMLIEDRNLITTGASTAVFSLVTRIIAETAGEELAQQTARMLAIDTERQSQAPYISQALLERPRHSLAEKISHFLDKELHNDISVSKLATHCGTSERSLLRHFRTHFGTGPLGHIQHLRVERAKALLEATQLSFDEVVERCGYSDSPSFRKLFKRETSLTPADYRERFRLRAR